ncbi:MAG TPA: DNA-binding domain-containing protein [Albitalea sp.]|nr:DNA-binding domain-containing protein [Albitalea sp.]
MNTLLAQQRALQRAITGGTLEASLLRRVNGREPLLRVYRHAYTERLAAALRDNFDTLPQVMGDEAFDALAQAYIDAHPSRHPSIRWFGDELPHFMAGREDLVAHPALVDLARMEWALRGAFDAADAVPLDASSMAAQQPGDWPRLQFEMLPSVRLLALQWAVEPLWRALQAMPPGEEAALPEPAALDHGLLVWRQGLETRWRSLDGNAAALLRAACEGRCFGDLCELAATQVGTGDAAAHAVAALQQWLADGLLASVRVAS